MLRRYTFKLYPNAAQEAAMREQARLCAVLWNALLEMRETRAINDAGKISRFDHRTVNRWDIDEQLAAIDARTPSREVEDRVIFDYTPSDRAQRNALFAKMRQRKNDARRVTAGEVFSQSKFDTKSVDVTEIDSLIKEIEGNGTVIGKRRNRAIYDVESERALKELRRQRAATISSAKIAAVGVSLKVLTAQDQGKDLTALGADPDCAEFKAIGRGTQERVADMLDLAFKAFLSRAKEGSGPAGYPKFKKTLEAENIPLREPVKSGWKFEPKGANGECLSGDFSAKKKREHLRKSGVSVGSGADSLQTRGDDRYADAPAFYARGADSLQTRGDDRKICVRENNNWRLTLRGVPGSIKARGKFPSDPESLKTADVKFYDGAWWFSVCVDVPARMVAGKDKLTVEFDLIDSFASVKSADGRCAPGLSDPFYSGRKGEFPNTESQARREGGLFDRPCGEPANAGEAQEQLAMMNAAVSCGNPSNEGEAQAFTQADAACGEPSNIGEAQGHGVDAIQSERDRRYKRGSIRWRREKQRIARIKAKQARRTKETLHKWTTAIVREAAELAIIAPPVKDMTRTGRGNEKAHGAEVKTVAALNRHVLSMAPASAVQMLEYKAAEAGIACAVERRQDHQIRIGGDLREAAVTVKRAKRIVKRKMKLLEAAE